MTSEMIAYTATEFPDYPLDSLPEIPAGFANSSWHNDTCPSFCDEEFSLRVFIDYPDPAARELPDSKRFTLYEGECDDVLVHTDDWNVILEAIDKVRKA